MFALHCKHFFSPSLLQASFFTAGGIRDGKEDSYPLSSTLSTRLCQTFRSASTYQFPQGEHLKCSYCFAAFLFPKVDPPEAQSFVELQKIKNMQQVEMDCNFLSKQFVYEMTKNRQKNGSLNRDLLNFLYRYGIFWMPPGESSHPGGSEYV